MLTLASMPIGARVRLGRTDRSGLPAAKARRLAELGLRAGMTVQVLSRTAGGGRIVAVADGRIALDQAVARAIPVQPPTRVDAR